MTEFEIGDVVRLKSDDESDLDVVVRGNTRGILLCVSECGNRVVRSWADKVVLVHRPDPHADIKQAIREVLLSDDFMKAFAAAWMKTPLPLAMQYDNKDGERIQSLTDYPFGEPSEGGKQ